MSKIMSLLPAIENERYIKIDLKLHITLSIIDAFMISHNVLKRISC